MRRHLQCALLLSACFLVRDARAQSIGIFFDATATLRAKVVPGFSITNFYVIGRGVDDITGWEAGVTDLVPLGWNVLGATLNPTNAINVGSINNFIVGLGSCVQPGGSPRILVSYQFGYFASPIAPSDVTVCTGPASPSSFAGAPGYATCADDLVSFELESEVQWWFPIPFGCGTINCTLCFEVATEKLSVGALKGIY